MTAISRSQRWLSKWKQDEELLHIGHYFSPLNRNMVSIEPILFLDLYFHQKSFCLFFNYYESNCHLHVSQLSQLLSNVWTCIYFLTHFQFQVKSFYSFEWFSFPCPEYLNFIILACLMSSASVLKVPMKMNTSRNIAMTVFITSVWMYKFSLFRSSKMISLTQSCVIPHLSFLHHLDFYLIEKKTFVNFLEHKQF